MKIDELEKYGIPNEFIQKLKSKKKISELCPPQAEIVKKKILKERNLIISLPTAAGKTLIAALAIINKIIEQRGKVIYIVPLVALANEKYNYFRKLFSGKYK